MPISTPAGTNERNFLSSSSLDSDFKEDIPSDELKDLPHEEALARMLFYWEDLTANVNKFSSMIRRLHEDCGQNFDLMDSKVDLVDARLGHCVLPSLSEHCITTWDGVAYVHNSLASLSSAFEDMKAIVTRLSGRLDQEHEANKLAGEKLVVDFTKGLNEVIELIRVEYLIIPRSPSNKSLR